MTRRMATQKHCFVPILSGHNRAETNGRPTPIPPSTPQGKCGEKFRQPRKPLDLYWYLMRNLRFKPISMSGLSTWISLKMEGARLSYRLQEYSQSGGGIATEDEKEIFRFVISAGVSSFIQSQAGTRVSSKLSRTGMDVSTGTVFLSGLRAPRSAKLSTTAVDGDSTTAVAHQTRQSASAHTYYAAQNKQCTM